MFGRQFCLLRDTPAQQFVVVDIGETLLYLSLLNDVYTTAYLLREGVG
jgi:hypothetical protein